MTTKSVTGLKRLYRGNSTARLILDYFASRDRNRESTNFNRVMAIMSAQDEAPTRARMREVFRTFEKLGFGTFVVGRRGHPTRFLWNTPLIEVGEMAQVPPEPKRVKAAQRGRASATAKRRNGRQRVAA